MSIPPPPAESPEPVDSESVPGDAAGAAAPSDPPRAGAPRYAPPVYAPPVQQPPLYGAPTPPPGYAPPAYGAPAYYAPPPNVQPGYGQPGYGQPGYVPYVAPGTFAVPGPGEPFDGAATPEDLARPLYGANPLQAFVRFFKNYASFSGRASRSEYWWNAMWWLVGWTAIGTISSAISAMSYQVAYVSDAADGFIGLVAFVAALGLVVPQLALIWRRLHDADLPGGLFFIVLFPFLGSIALLIFLALPPKVSGRRFARSY